MREALVGLFVLDMARLIGYKSPKDVFDNVASLEDICLTHNGKLC